MTKKEDELYADRLSKLKKLRQSGVDPYPHKAEKKYSVAQILANFEKLQATSKMIETAGRLKAIRRHGKIIFGNLEDETGTVQFLAKVENIGEAHFASLDFFDIGDVIELSGKLVLTKTHEKTVNVSKVRLLAKSLRSLPEKFHGLKDLEVRLRKRYLDMLANPEVRELFVKKNIFWQTARQFFAKEHFLEVQTPVLESVPGGADAEPFITHHNALDRDFYLRISLELPLKRLLVGGFEKVFEIGRLFRNEGIDREHLQEYDDLEFYMSYADNEFGMSLVEKLFKEIVKNVCDSKTTVYENKKLNWQTKWAKIDYFAAFKKETGLDLENNLTLEDLKITADKLGIKYEPSYGRGRIIDAIFKKTVRSTLVQPCFLIGHPIEISPLAKRDPSNPKKVLRFQVLAAGTELGNGWAELNDPIDQRKRFEEQMQLRSAGDKEAQMMDGDFVEALEYGMPPAVGFGMSERLFAVLMNKSIRETVIFPPMRPDL